MFSVYINDLVTLLKRYNVRIKLFADDVKLYTKVVSYLDINELHTALTALVSWAEMWQLSISIDKCGLLSLVKIFSWHI